MGRFEGTVGGSVYYTVSNDGRSVHAVDVISGKTLWQTELPEPAGDGVQVRLVDSAVLLAYQPRGKAESSADAIVARLSADAGALSWSKKVACANAFPPSAGPRFYLLCLERPSGDAGAVLELEPGTGVELARFALLEPVEFTTAGGVCGRSTRGTVWCGRIGRGGIETVWSERASGTRFDGIHVVGEFVVLTAEGEIEVRSTRDGRLVWQRRGVDRVVPHATAGNLLVLNRAGCEVVRLSDGARLARLPPYIDFSATVLSDDNRFVIEPNAGVGEVVYLLDPELRARVIAKNVPFLDHIAKDVVLSQNVGLSGTKRDVAALEAYSLSQFAPPHDQLNPQDKIVSVLERAAFSYDASQALAALGQIPGAMDAVEKILDGGPVSLQEPAIEIAGRSGHARFLAPLRRKLESIDEAPVEVHEWSAVLDIVQAMSNLESPEAAAALLAFWRRLGEKFSPAWRRTILRDLVASAIWRYGAINQWVSCQDTVFTSSPVAPERALLGTQSPGVEYAVDDQRRWAAICEARNDDDGSGRLEVVILHHGDTGGDQLEPYLVLGNGPGTPIDDFVAADPSGRWIVVTKDMCVHLVDAQSGKGVVLSGADGRPGDTVRGAHRAAHFSPDGRSLLYIRSNGDRANVVVRDLASGAERVVDPGPGLLSAAFFDQSGRSVVMDVVVTDTDRDGRLRRPELVSTLSTRRCRGPAASASFFGDVGDQPIQRIAPASGGRVENVPRGKRLEPIELPSPRYELVGRKRARALPETLLPLGPLRWRPRRYR